VRVIAPSFDRFFSLCPTIQGLPLKSLLTGNNKKLLTDGAISTGGLQITLRDRNLQSSWGKSMGLALGQCPCSGVTSNDRQPVVRGFFLGVSFANFPVGPRAEEYPKAKCSFPPHFKHWRRYAGNEYSFDGVLWNLWKFSKGICLEIFLYLCSIGRQSTDSQKNPSKTWAKKRIWLRQGFPLIRTQISANKYE
jgi:hypothetical protein